MSVSDICVVILTGYGNIAPATNEGRIATMLYATIGIPLCLIVLADLGKLFTRGTKFLWSFIRRFYYTGRCKRIITNPDGSTETKEVPTNDPVFVVDDEFNLPVIVAIFITIAYILLGSVMYPQWEDNWSWFDSFYFIFISISTIGFGDVLPDHPRYFLLSSIYVLIGLALVSMVINVIMESLDSHITKAKNKMEEVSKSIGISLDNMEEVNVAAKK